MSFIHLAFRFHTNFNHSYRGDSPDETGIGKDIRIVRGILDNLDKLNDEGIPVVGTWDIDNYFTLSRLIPDHAPDILERWQKRVKTGRDEIEVMSWNNGLVSAQTEEEFRRTMEWTISNPEGSGLSDLFDKWAPIVRPQECMFTPGHLRLYKEFGIQALSLFYSAHPFNGFSTHVPLLGIEERYNPLTLSCPGFNETLTLLPAYNDGDIADYFGLRPWLKYMRKKQKDRDLLLIIDVDADDTFWEGFGKIPAALSPSAGGFYSMVQSVADLPYLKFARPWDYLQTHESAGSVSFGQDTADGSYDGLSSWAEKRENTRLWTGIERSRILENWTKETLMEHDADGEIKELLETALRSRLIAQSSTHFGMASPVMHAERLVQGEQIVEEAYQASLKALNLSKPENPVKNRQDDGPILVPIPDRQGNWNLPAPETAARRRVPGELPESQRGVDSNRTLISGRLSLSMDLQGHIHLAENGDLVLNPRFSVPSLRYDGKEPPFQLKDFRPPMVVSEGLTRMTQTMETELPGGAGRVFWNGDFYTGDGQPWILADIRVRYPLTPDKPGDKAKAGRLSRSWDRRWQEIRPFEISPNPGPDSKLPGRIWKQNYIGNLSCYDISAERVSSMNNQITGGWLAYSGGGRGVLIAASAVSEMNFAFCPVRSSGGRKAQLRMNPFGTYSGRQRRYPSAHSGLGRFLALRMADHLDSYAPSFNGEQQRVTVLLMPYSGERPPEELIRAANRFSVPAYPGYVPWGDETFPRASQR